MGQGPSKFFFFLSRAPVPNFPFFFYLFICECLHFYYHENTTLRQAHPGGNVDTSPSQNDWEP